MVRSHKKEQFLQVNIMQCYWWGSINRAALPLLWSYRYIHRYTRYISMNTEQMNSFVKNFLDLSRPQRMNPADFDNPLKLTFEMAPMTSCNDIRQHISIALVRMLV